MASLAAFSLNSSYYLRKFNCGISRIIMKSVIGIGVKLTLNKCYKVTFKVEDRLLLQNYINWTETYPRTVRGEIVILRNNKNNKK